MYSFSLSSHTSFKLSTRTTNSSSVSASMIPVCKSPGFPNISRKNSIHSCLGICNSFNLESRFPLKCKKHLRCTALSKTICIALLRAFSPSVPKAFRFRRDDLRDTRDEAKKVVCFKLLLFVNHNWAHHNWMVTAEIDKHWVPISCDSDIKVTQIEGWINAQNCAVLSGTKPIQVIQGPVTSQNRHWFWRTADYPHECFTFFPLTLLTRA